MIGGIGFVAALILGISAVTFAVQMDPREKAVLDQLPGANCGACGYAGCAAFAHEITVNPETEMACPAVNENALKAMSDILGRELGGSAGFIAFVGCKGSPDQTVTRYNYVGPRDCRAAQIVAGGSRDASTAASGLEPVWMYARSGLSTWAKTACHTSLKIPVPVAENVWMHARDRSCSSYRKQATTLWDASRETSRRT